MNKRIWLSSPHIGNQELENIRHIFSDNWIAPVGPDILKFEEDISKYLEQEVFCTALNSGTSAIHIALLIEGISKNDEVICQSLTFAGSANPILYQGAIPVFVDSESHTWNICPIQLEKAIKDRLSKGKKPKAIIAVDIYGMPYNKTEINEISQYYDIPIIEDSADALGSSFKGKKCGTFGKYGIFSFNGNKIITTSSGGMILSKDKAVQHKALFYATQSKDIAAHYQHSEIGYNYRMSNVLAGIGRGQMEVLDKHIQLRQANHRFYINLFKDSQSITVFKEPTQDYISNHWLSCILTDSFETRENIRIALDADNIESRPLWKPMHLQPVFEKYPYYGNKVSENLFEKGLCLPSGSNLTGQDRERISDILFKYA
jgi:dTDP-4-amino-4,6-dideoxygalactose transaminase